ncbi:Protein Wnt-11 [Sparganum proliferum]
MLPWTLCLLCVLSVQTVGGIKWLSLYRYPRSKSLERESFSTDECTYAFYRFGLGKKQIKFCRHPRQSYAMHAVLKSAQAVSYYCPQIFKDRRWNCSSVELLPYTTPDLRRGTREQAAVYALASATLMFEVARRCAMNKVVGCECGTENWDIPPQPHMVDEPLDTNGKAPIQYHWGGCADNIHVGREYTKAFLGVRRDAPPTPRRIPVEYRSNPLFSVPVERFPMPMRLQPRKATNFKNVMRTVNLHNYKVGIKIIEETQKVRCKCQGVSGSCAQKICFRQLLRADSAQLQDVIRQRYMTAKHASVEYGNLLIAKEFNYGSYVPRVVHHGELVFLEHSPDYCDRDPHLGSVGTHGRSCTMDPEKKGHSEHCNNMCCGRGARHYNETVMDNCNCRMTKQFKVVCEQCKKVIRRSVCL